jgi:hypothetical protein
MDHVRLAGAIAASSETDLSLEVRLIVRVRLSPQNLRKEPLATCQDRAITEEATPLLG